MMVKEIKISTGKLITDLGGEVRGAVDSWGIVDGFIHVMSRHTTAGIRVMENEVLLISDIDDLMNRLMPVRCGYNHDKIGVRNDISNCERMNAHSHLRALLFNTSELIPVVDGKLVMGPWQSIVMVELDNEPQRTRRIAITGVML